MKAQDFKDASAIQSYLNLLAEVKTNPLATEGEVNWDLISQDVAELIQSVSNQLKINFEKAVSVAKGRLNGAFREV